MAVESTPTSRPIFIVFPMAVRKEAMASTRRKVSSVNPLEPNMLSTSRMASG